jgi:dTDP-4-dehydrorhamnose reductase
VKQPLVIGGNGLVGSILAEGLRPKPIVTTRRTDQPDRLFMDLSEPVKSLPDHDVVFIVAAVNGFQACEGNPVAYRVNVDAPIAIARLSKSMGGFPVFVSSDSVEWCGSSAYARQKALAEIGLTMCDGAIVRPNRITPAKVGLFVRFLIELGKAKTPGIHRYAG